MFPVSARESPKLIIDLNEGSHDDDSHAILRIGAAAIKMIKFIAIVSRKVEQEEEEAMRKIYIYYYYVTTHASSVMYKMLVRLLGSVCLYIEF